MLSVLHRNADSDCPFGIFKLFLCLQEKDQRLRVLFLDPLEILQFIYCMLSQSTSCDKTDELSMDYNTHPKSKLFLHIG